MLGDNTVTLAETANFMKQKYEYKFVRLGEGWLSAKGLEQICRFMTPHTGTAMHPPGAKRCASMRICYKNAIKYGVNRR